VDKIMSACGVLCSGCAAYKARERGAAYQKEASEAWARIYAFQTPPEKMTCDGCLSADGAVFYTSVRCQARRCCRSKDLPSCAECAEETCALLAKAQSNWDSVPAILDKLSASDRERYAEPYYGHRERLEKARREYEARKHM